MSSRDLLTSVAELSVIIRPIAHVGWRRASSAVTSASSARVRPRNGPPDAVRTSEATSSLAPARRHCAIAECSESTGINCPGAAAPVTSAPPATSDSLLARASRAPERRAARVGPSPLDPSMPLSTTSDSTASTSRVAADGPDRTVTSGNAEPIRPAAVGSDTATKRAPVVRICSARRSTRPPPAARPTTSKRSAPACEVTSSAWVPIEPVLPRTRTRVVTPPLSTPTAVCAASDDPLGASRGGLGVDLRTRCDKLGTMSAARRAASEP